MNVRTDQSPHSRRKPDWLRLILGHGLAQFLILLFWCSFLLDYGYSGTRTGSLFIFVLFLGLMLLPASIIGLVNGTLAAKATYPVRLLSSVFLRAILGFWVAWIGNLYLGVLTTNWDDLFYSESPPVSLFTYLVTLAAMESAMLLELALAFTVERSFTGQQRHPLEP